MDKITIAIIVIQVWIVIMILITRSEQKSLNRKLSRFKQFKDKLNDLHDKFFLSLEKKTIARSPKKDNVTMFNGFTRYSSVKEYLSCPICGIDIKDDREAPCHSKDIKCSKCGKTLRLESKL